MVRVKHNDTKSRPNIVLHTVTNRQKMYRLLIFFAIVLAAVALFIGSRMIFVTHKSYPIIRTECAKPSMPIGKHVSSVVAFSPLPASDYPMVYSQESWEQPTSEIMQVDHDGESNIVQPTYVQASYIQTQIPIKDPSNEWESRKNALYAYYTNALESKGWDADSNNSETNNNGEWHGWSKDGHYFEVGRGWLETSYTGTSIEQTIGVCLFIEYN